VVPGDTPAQSSGALIMMTCGLHDGGRERFIIRPDLAYHSPFRCRTIAGLSGFFTFNQCPDRPD
jgi:hypothetical protein